MTFKVATNNAPAIPEASKKRWNKRIFKEIGTNAIKAKATHFLANSSAPIKISKVPTVFKTYPVAAREDIKAAALAGSSGKGINGVGKSLFNPNKTRSNPRSNRTILVNIEFIIVWFNG